MIVLGIDPGTATTGYGVIEKSQSGVKFIEFGLIETAKVVESHRRLAFIHNDIVEKINSFKPDVMAIEKIFFATNAKTAISVGQAIGVMLLAAAHTGINVAEYAPGTIKKQVAGDGRADKKAMQKAVREILGGQVNDLITKKTHFDNAADALAVALCHVYYQPSS